MAKVNSTQWWWLDIDSDNKSRQDICDLFLVRPGMPGPLHSAELVAHTWVGSSQPLRKTCVRHASGAWPVQRCSPVSHPRKVTKGGRALVSFACDIGLLVPQHLSSMDVNELCSYFQLSINTSCHSWQQIQFISAKVTGTLSGPPDGTHYCCHCFSEHCVLFCFFFWYRDKVMERCDRLQLDYILTS